VALPIHTASADSSSSRSRHADILDGGLRQCCACVQAQAVLCHCGSGRDCCSCTCSSRLSSSIHGRQNLCSRWHAADCSSRLVLIACC
jgi:hypothetical protein